jgi:carbon monoxide dehydrogenase subunit G
MKIAGHTNIAGTPDAVMAAMNSAEVLQAIMPSCSGARQVGPGRFVATVTRKVGPLSLSVEPEIEVAPLQDGQSRLTIRAGSRIVGQVQAELGLTLGKGPIGTQLAWDGEVSATGLAQRMLAERAARVSALVSGLFNELKHKVEKAV